MLITSSPDHPKTPSARQALAATSPFRVKSLATNLSFRGLGFGNQQSGRVQGLATITPVQGLGFGNQHIYSRCSAVATDISVWVLGLGKLVGFKVRKFPVQVYSETSWRALPQRLP